MNAHTLNLAGFFGTLNAIAKGPGTSAVSETRKVLQERADAPHSLTLSGRRCPECDGLGIAKVAAHSYDRCPACGGSGRVPDDEDDFGPPVIEDHPNGWDDPDVDRYGDEESVADGFEEQF